jgi:hypothetical protein
MALSRTESCPKDRAFRVALRYHLFIAEERQEEERPEEDQRSSETFREYIHMLYTSSSPAVKMARRILQAVRKIARLG